MSIVFKLTELLRNCSKQTIHILIFKNTRFNCLNKAADGESLELYLKDIFKKLSF